MISGLIYTQFRAKIYGDCETISLKICWRRAWFVGSNHFGKFRIFFDCFNSRLFLDTFTRLCLRDIARGSGRITTDYRMSAKIMENN